jgi:hypothetical protein
MDDYVCKKNKREIIYSNPIKMNFFSRIIYLALIAGEVFLINGCATGSETDYRLGATSSHSRTVQKDGLEITIDPIIDRERSRHYFGIDAANEGIAIFFVRAANRSQDRTFIVEKKDFRLHLPPALQGRALGTGDVKRDTSGAETTAWIVGGIAGGAGLGMAFAAITSNQSMEIQRNFVAKEMPDQTLAPGESMEGFIYYRSVPKDGSWTRGSAIKINLPETTSHNENQIIVDFD